MYIPSEFQEQRPDMLLAFMQAYPFVTMATPVDGYPAITHLPVLINRLEGGAIVLRSHLARINPHARLLEKGAASTAVFQGPHAYVSPRWYSNPVSVPTWNYVSVHASGQPRLLQEPGDVLQLMEDMISCFEPDFMPRYKSLPERYRDGLIQGIVAFEIHVEKLEGAFKLSQNKPAQDREHIISELSQSGDTAIQAIAEYMRRY